MTTATITCPVCQGTGRSGIFQCEICRGQGNVKSIAQAAARIERKGKLDAEYVAVGSALIEEVAATEGEVKDDEDEE